MARKRTSGQALPLAGIVLAAGSGQRYGACKQLLAIDGQPMVVRALRLAAPICDAGVIVVTGASQEAVVAATAGEPARCVYNPAWREGMGASLRQGVRAVRDESAAILVLLADQVALTMADIEALQQNWQKYPPRPAAAGYGGQIGVPAIFPPSWRARLLALHGDTGARALLADADTLTVPMPNAATDVDTPEDYHRLVGSDA
jgi:molybdenum cofactor cytidylyltransferase